MNFGDWPKAALRIVTTLWAAALLALTPQLATAQDAPAETTEVAASEVAADVAAVETEAADSSGYTPLGPDWIRGQPVDGGYDVQPQYSEIGAMAQPFHYALFWVMVVISVFVLFLLLYVVVRFRKSANPVPSKTTHNTFIEVVWTVIPVLVLVAIAIPSIILLQKQYETAPAEAVTIKATGYQWYWGYSYPDYGSFEVISNMLPEDEAVANGEPAQLAVDNRMVVPANTPIRLQTTSADVIHAFAVPSLWFKIDAVPGRLNERLLTITEPGIYYGQCSELCGVKHGYMPIAVEALPREQFDAWILSKGGTLPGADEDAADDTETEAAEEPAAEDAAPEDTADAAEAAE